MGEVVAAMKIVRLSTWEKYLLSWQKFNPVFASQENVM